MKPTTVRLPEDELEELAREAEERGFANRTEYIRWILRNRNGIDTNTAERLDELEERLAEVEDKIEE